MSRQTNRSPNRFIHKPFLTGMARGFGYKSAGTGYIPGSAQSSEEARAQDGRAIGSYWRATGQFIQNAMEIVDAELRSKQQ